MILLWHIHDPCQTPTTSQQQTILSYTKKPATALPSNAKNVRSVSRALRTKSDGASVRQQANTDTFVCASVPCRCLPPAECSKSIIQPLQRRATASQQESGCMHLPERTWLCVPHNCMPLLYCAHHSESVGSPKSFSSAICCSIFSSSICTHSLCCKHTELSHTQCKCILRVTDLNAAVALLLPNNAYDKISTTTIC